MMFPLVRELAADGIPVTVTCRVLKICSPALLPVARPSRSPTAELDEAWLANAIFDAHRDDPEFGYRFLADEVRRRRPRRVGPGGVADLPGQRLVVGVRQAQAPQGLQARHAVARRPRAPRASPPTRPNDAVAGRHHRALDRRGQALLCAIKDLFSNRIVG